MPMRTAPDGREYRQCEAQVYTDEFKNETRLCKRAAAKGDRLCGNHASLRKYVNADRYVITISRKGDYIRETGRYRKTIVGKVFNSHADANLWIKLNATQIFALPHVKSYCIEPARRILK